MTERARMVKGPELGLGGVFTGEVFVDVPVIPGEKPPGAVMSPALAKVMDELREEAEARKKKAQDPRTSKTAQAF